MDRKVMTPEETREALSGSGRKVITYPGEVDGFPGVTFSFEIQRVVGAPHIAWDAIPALDDREETRAAEERTVWHPDMPGEGAKGPWRCASESEAEVLVGKLRAERPDSGFRVRRDQDEGSTGWIVSEHRFDPEAFWRYQRARVSGGCYRPRVYFGRREETPDGWLHYRDIPDGPQKDGLPGVFTWLYEEIEAHCAGSPLRSGVDGRFPDAGGADGAGPGCPTLPLESSDAGAGLC